MARKPNNGKSDSHETAFVKVEELRPNPENPNRHPETQIQMLMASLQRDGQTKPILVRKANHMIIAGHGVQTAARRLGWAEMQAVLWDVDQATADRVMLADQRLATLSDMDKGRVANLMREIGEGDWLSTGYTVEEAAKVLEAYTEDDLEVFEIETANVTDHYWIAVRGPLREQAAVLVRMKELLKEYPTAAIEVGTVEDQ